jgi:hypothetical protein
MRYIPMSFFGDEAEFPKFSVAYVAAFSGTKDVEVQYPNTFTGSVELSPLSTNVILTSSLQKMVFNTFSSDNTIIGSEVNVYSQPFFTTNIGPSDGCSTYTFYQGSTGGTTTIDYVQPNNVSQSYSVVNDPFSYNIACRDAGGVNITGAGSSVSKSFDAGYDSFLNVNPSNKIYKIKFTSKGSSIATGSIAIINYVDAGGNLQNYTLSGVGSTIEFNCQTSLHLAGGDPILNQVNLEQEIITPINLGVTPYPYHDKLRQYRIVTQFDAGTLAGQFNYMSGSQKFTQNISTKNSSYDVYATNIPMLDRCAMATINDISNWDIIALASSSLSSSICSETSSAEYYINAGDSLEVGTTIYTNHLKTNTVPVSFFRQLGSELYYETNVSGEIVSEENCAGDFRNVIYDIESGSEMNFTNQTLSASSGFISASLNVEQHFISGTFGGQETLEVNCPTTNSGSAEIKYTVPASVSPTGSFSFLSSFYHNGNPVWTIDSNIYQNIVGDFDEDPGNDIYGIRLKDINGATIVAGSESVNIGSGSFNNGGWNIFQYSLDNSTSPPTCNYNINGIYSGSFNAQNTVANIEEIIWNKNDAGTNPDSKLDNGSHFQVLDISLHPRTTSSMDTLFTEYNRYGL